MTKIQWTEVTWNPIVGCSVESPGCKNCYAMTRVAPRLAENPATPHYHGTVEKTAKGKYVWTGKIGIASDKKFEEPLRWKKPKMVFVNSVSDLFHPNVPDEIIDRVFAIMALSNKHTFQVLTKHPQRMARYFFAGNSLGCVGERIASICMDMALDNPSLFPKTNLDYDDSWPVDTVGPSDDPHGLVLKRWPLPNVWLGTSVEDQTRANERIPALLDTPAAVRFVSAEPLLEEVRLDKILIQKQNQMFLDNALTGFSIDRTNIGSKIDWVIVGGESGHGARPMHPNWARSLRDQCQAAGVPYFLKQWGEWLSPFQDNQGAFIDDVCEQSRFKSCVWDTEKLTWEETNGTWDDDENWIIASHSRDDEQQVFKVGTKATGRMLDDREWNEMPEVQDD